MRDHFKLWALLLFLLTPLAAAAGLFERQVHVELFDPKQVPEPIGKGKLGISVDFGLAIRGSDKKEGPQNRRLWVFTSHLTFREDVSSISDGVLLTMAADGLQEVKRFMVEYGISGQFLPAVMTVLASGKEIILASSMKGNGGLHIWHEEYPPFGPGTLVSHALNTCQMAWREANPDDPNQDKYHMHNGRCGEPMAVHLWHLDKERKGDTKPLSEMGARIVSAGFNKRKEKITSTEEDYEYKPTCPLHIYEDLGY
ncbi:uncharacterized protein PgNI_09261 [Pyricularia grisea]|uniref:Uncharacterized protein n=1 Tax=Pyricularia grisea TaxID=148305 RepID=A0A6P8ASA9_PYRGI|nr:uncharacterized protein PgNI_09261 [Pyricularia grisea]TLD05010.1 hypothetical protein PgNI_09261 [Pyricularia grisea]